MCVSRTAATLQDYISDEKMRLIKILVSRTVPGTSLFKALCETPGIQRVKGEIQKTKLMTS